MKKGELPADYRFAPALYRQQVEESTPTNYGTGGWGPLNLRGAAEDKNFSGFFEDPDNHALKVAHDMIDDMQRSRNRNTF